MTEVAASILDNYPVGVPDRPVLVDPFLEGDARTTRPDSVCCPRSSHVRFVERFPDDLVVAVLELSHDSCRSAERVGPEPEIQPARNTIICLKLVVPMVVYCKPEVVELGNIRSEEHTSELQSRFDL